jgi:hypothetical protein
MQEVNFSTRIRIKKSGNKIDDKSLSEILIREKEVLKEM